MCQLFSQNIQKICQVIASEIFLPCQIVKMRGNSFDASFFCTNEMLSRRITRGGCFHQFGLCLVSCLCQVQKVDDITAFGTRCHLTCVVNGETKQPPPLNVDKEEFSQHFRAPESRLLAHAQPGAKTHVRQIYPLHSFFVRSFRHIPITDGDVYLYTFPADLTSPCGIFCSTLFADSRV